MSHKIRNKIDKAIGDHKIFTDEDKKAIYAKIEQEKENHQKKRSKDKFGIITAYTLATALLLMFGWLGIQSHFDKSGQQNQINKTLTAQQPSVNHSKHRSKIRTEKSFREYVNQSLGKKHPDQFRIVKKMYFSLEYIHSAQGELVWGNSVHGNTSRAKFHIDFDKKRSLKKVKDLKNGKVIQATNSLVREGLLTKELPKKHIFYKGPVKSDNILGSMLVAGGIVTQNQWFVRIANDYSHWHYTMGKKFGMPVYEIKGIDQLNRPFTMTVSKDTGALLGLKSYDKKNKNKLTFFIAVKNIKINQGIPDRVFHLDVSSDKEMPWGKYLSQINGAHKFNGQKICGQNCTGSHHD